MSESAQKKQDQLETTKHTEENSIIQERLPNRNNGEPVRKYARGKLLGKGGFAKCYQATNLDTRRISAIKIVCKQNLKKAKTKQKLITEIKIHKSLKHPRVVGFDHVFEDNENVYILLQLCPNNTLSDLLKKRKRLNQYEAQYFIMQLTEGLAYLHSNKVIHRDLKLGNLMLGENMDLKIGDFGLAARIEAYGERKKTICGTPNYIAPEILDGKGHSYEVDIWSMGAILYALLYGRPPFETSDVKKTYKKIKQCQYAFNDEIDVSSNAKNLISRLLVVDPTKRLTLEQIRSHPFLSESRIPLSLPISIFNTGMAKPHQNQLRNKTSDKQSRIQSGISDRLLLRTPSGISRNYFSKPSSEKNVLTKHSNNYFNVGVSSSLPESSRRAKEIIMQGNMDTNFVKKWVDYSSKYGLGYLLSNHSTGIYFNDCSKIVVDANSEDVDYVSVSGQLSSFAMSSQPSDRELAKKLTLMQYFSKYLNSGGQHHRDQAQRGGMFCYVKKWAKSEQGIIFRLSNKVIQVNFSDKTQMVIYAHKNVGVFSGVSLGAEKVFFQLDGPETKHPYLAKKIEEMAALMRLMAKPPRQAKPSQKQDREIFVVEDL